jgi:hypothetical protein
MDSGRDRRGAHQKAAPRPRTSLRVLGIRTSRISPHHNC